MLVLSRKMNETVCIGPTIEVQVLEIHGDRVKLGIIGPPEVGIHREEVYRRIQEGAKRLVPVASAMPARLTPKADVRLYAQGLDRNLAHG